MEEEEEEQPYGAGRCEIRQCLVPGSHSFGETGFILVRAACVFGRLPGNSLRFLPPIQAASEQKGKQWENLRGVSADATFSPSAVGVPSAVNVSVLIPP